MTKFQLIMYALGSVVCLARIPGWYCEDGGPNWSMVIFCAFTGILFGIVSISGFWMLKE